MTIVSSGPISINSLVGEYGGSAPHSLSEYYRGGGLVANHSNNANVPTSGTISLSNFYGANNTAPVTIDNQVSGTFGTAQPGFSKYNDVYRGIITNNQPIAASGGSWSDNTFTNPSGTQTFTLLTMGTFTSTINNSSYIIMPGNIGHGQTFSQLTGRSGIFKIGGTTYINLGTLTGTYVSSRNSTQWFSGLVNQFPTSGFQTVTIT